MWLNEARPIMVIRSIFTAIPLPYDAEDPRFWYSDAGAMALAFESMGVHSRFVCHGRQGADEKLPLILCTPQEMADSAWWRRQNPDAVLITSWGAPRYEPIVRAIKQSGARLIVRLDTDGMKSPRISFLSFLKGTYNMERDQRGRMALPYSLAKTLALRFVPGAFDRGTCRHLEHADLILAESDIAHQRMTAYCNSVKRPDLAARLRVLPHPAQVDRGWDISTPKVPRIMAAGRWLTHQKDGSLLLRTIAKVLEHREDAHAWIAGSGTEELELHCRHLPPVVRRRLTFAGVQEHSRLVDTFRSSQVLLFSSRYEGFPFSACEALCTGCTVVGPDNLAFMHHVVSRGGGTAASGRTTASLSEAVCKELDLWATGRRNARAISSTWMDTVSDKAEGAILLEWLSALKSQPS